MEPVWALERNTSTGLHFWSRLDRSPETKSVRFKCDVEVKEYVVHKEQDNTERPNDNPSQMLLLASLAIIMLTFTYKIWCATS